MIDHPFAESAGAYTLGALPAGEVASYEAHLSDCDVCRRQVDEFSGLSGVLARVPVDAYFGPVPAPSVLPGLVQAAHQRRVRHRWVAASAALVAAALVFVSVVLSRPAPPHLEAMTTVGASDIRASAQVTGVPWGTRIFLRCRYEETGPDYPSSAYYGVAVIDRGRRVHPLGTWSVKPDGVTKYVTGTNLHLSDLSSIEVTSPDGKPVLSLPVT